MEGTLRGESVFVLKKRTFVSFEIVKQTDGLLKMKLQVYSTIGKNETKLIRNSARFILFPSGQTIKNRDCGSACCRGTLALHLKANRSG